MLTATGAVDRTNTVTVATVNVSTLDDAAHRRRRSFAGQRLGSWEMNVSPAGAEVSPRAAEYAAVATAQAAQVVQLSPSAPHADGPL